MQTNNKSTKSETVKYKQKLVRKKYQYKAIMDKIYLPKYH